MRPGFPTLGFLTRNRRDKIVAVCSCLAVGSAALLAARSLGLPERTGGFVTLDDYLFGHRTGAAWLVELADVFVQLAVVRLLLAGRRAYRPLGLIWTGLLLVEGGFDVAVFADDPHMLLEEGAFIGIYGYLFLLLCGQAATGSARPGCSPDVSVL